MWIDFSNGYRTFFWFSDIAGLFFGSFESKKLEFAQDI